MAYLGFCYCGFLDGLFGGWLQRALLYLTQVLKNKKLGLEIKKAK
jgi:hypothetical protein